MICTLFSVYLLSIHQTKSANLLSILIPAYNEETTIYQILENVSSVQLTDYIKKEIIVVDDGSNDNTIKEVKRFQALYSDINLNLIVKDSNYGKGNPLFQMVR